MSQVLNAWDGRIRVDVEESGCVLRLAQLGHHVYVEYIATAQKKAGYGSAIMLALTDWADRNGVTLALGPTSEYGTSLRVLHRFYARHGFTATGRNPLVWASLVRYPAPEGV
ncbi:hypothetical protein AB0B94_30970 [Micromonospora sp. NPDC048986]|uniref:hypothetical protein n=1 Tax=Micromonospora sp. NPDC048986 TaxID=3155644 RepID=UPI0033D4EE51